MSENSDSTRVRPWHFLLIAAAVFLLDALTKRWVKATIPLNGSIEVIPGLFRLTHLENTGAAFSMFADSPGPWPNRLLVLFGLTAMVVIGIFLWRRGRGMNRTNLSLALFLGGTLGNLFDRVTRGQVTDFLDVFIGHHHWPPFNVADSAVVLGALLLLSEIVWTPRRDKTGRF